MWKKSENSESLKPVELEPFAGGFIVRRNFKKIQTGDTPEHWEYEEWQMSQEQYEIYTAMQSESADIEDALIELAELIMGGE